MAENRSDVKQIEISSAILFILAAFSTILAIIPLISLQEHDDQSVNSIQYYNALNIVNQPFNEKLQYILLKLYYGLHEFDKVKDLEANLIKHIEAYNILHDFNKVKDLFYNFNNFSDIKYNPVVNLEIAKMYYEDGNLVQAKNYLHRINYHMRDKDENTISAWYIDRLINTYSRNWTGDTKLIEDGKCNILRNNYNNVKTHKTDNDQLLGTCTSKELRDINDNLTTINEKGIQNGINNSTYTKNSLDKPIEDFVSTLDAFMIGSVMTGPIIFIVLVRYFIPKIEDNNSKRENEKESGKVNNS